MKVVILAGGMGTRLSEETDLKPKPMVEIGEKPMLWHIMKLYSHYGFNDFIICLGYKGYMIKEYFANYFLHQADVTIDMKTNKMEIHHQKAEPWKVTLVDTGLNTMTGGRIKKVAKYTGNKPFFLTYGDGLSDVNIKALVEFHKKSGNYATLTAVQTLGRFGALEIGARGGVNAFREKPIGDGAWINGGFFVLEPEALDYITGGDSTVWEREPLERLARENKLGAYKHSGFWKCMDTLRDKVEFEKLWRDNTAPWKR
ncbi:MAG: glucose-1-phosphate cytidylyltransferase [Elusimicrobiales bacterium]|jgi:glucose-1-phosphate cytidylyltransferase